MVGLRPCALAMTLLLLASARTVAEQTITEFPLPTPPPDSGSGGIRITAGPDGALWFTALHWNEIGRITTEGAVTEFLIPVPAPRQAIVSTNIAAGPDGALWFGFVTAISYPAYGDPGGSASIGRITTTGEFTAFPLPSKSMATFEIAAGPDGGLWFSEQAAYKIGRITATGAIDEFPLPPRLFLSGLMAGPDGAVWFSRGNKMGQITTDGTVTEFLLPSVSRALTAGTDGALWFTEIGRSKIGRITTTGTITEFPLPVPRALWFLEQLLNKSGRTTTTARTITEFLLSSSNSQPGQITAGPDGAVWFTEANKIGRITTTGEFREFSLPTPDSRPNDITAGPDGAVWFTEGFPDKNSKIGRIGQIDEDVKTDLQTSDWERWVLYLEIAASSGIILAGRLKCLNLH